MRYLSSLFLFFLLVSCRSLDPTTLHHAIQHYTTQHNVTHDTIVIRDSIFISERQRGDTVYLTRVEYRDRWRTHLVHDTVVKTDSIVQVIEHPPRALYPALSQNMHYLVLSPVYRIDNLFILQVAFMLNKGLSYWNSPLLH